jgi:hypothetical protein
VVPGHKRATQVDGAYLTSATRGVHAGFSERTGVKWECSGPIHSNDKAVPSEVESLPHRQRVPTGRKRGEHLILFMSFTQVNFCYKLTKFHPYRSLSLMKCPAPLLRRQIISVNLRTFFASFGSLAARFIWAFFMAAAALLYIERKIVEWDSSRALCFVTFAFLIAQLQGYHARGPTH